MMIAPPVPDRQEESPTVAAGSGWQIVSSVELGLRPSGLRVSIAQSGAMTLTRVAYRAIGEPTHVALLRHPDRPAVFGLCGADKDADGAVPVHCTTYSRTVTCRHFLKAHGFLPDRATTYRTSLEDGVLIVHCDEPGIPIGKSGRPRMPRAGDPS